MESRSRRAGRPRRAARCTVFGAFAPTARRCAVRLVDGERAELATHAMIPRGGGYWRATVPGVGHGALYRIVLEDRAFADPFARYLPQGVHGPGMVIDQNAMNRRERGPLFAHARPIVYELHVGTFTPQGTFLAAIERLDHLVDLGVTTIELMPIAAFDGARGWGYDGVAPYAPHAPYGSPEDLCRLVDEAHRRGLSIWLDVVYNNYGPSGNYLGVFDPTLFSPEERNAWGDALDFRHPLLRRHVVDLAIHWLRDYRFDSLRLDATHAIVDRSEKHVLRVLVDAVRRLSPPKTLVAEDERNDPSLRTEIGLDAIWADDFHHQVHVLLTGESTGYYAAFEPSVADLARVVTRGWLFEGQAERSSGKPRGAPADALPAHAFVHCIQNHDQIGNRAFGERLSALTSVEGYRAATALLLFLPTTPLLFMGQEWGTASPFLYFTDHDAELGPKVSAGRRAELAAFPAFSDPAVRETIPDPQSWTTFAWSKLDWSELQQPTHAETFDLYRWLIALRRTDPVLALGGRESLTAEARGQTLLVTRRHGPWVRTLLVNFGMQAVALDDLLSRFDRGTLLLRTGPAPIADVLHPLEAAIFASEQGAVRRTP